MPNKKSNTESFISKHASKITIVFVVSVMYAGMLHLVDGSDKLSFPDCVKTPQVQTSLYDYIHSKIEEMHGNIKSIDLELVEDLSLEEGKKVCTTKATTKLTSGEIIETLIKYNISWVGEEDNSIETVILENK